MYDQVVKCQRAGLCLSEHFLIVYLVLDVVVVLHCIRVQLVIVSYVYSNKTNNHNAANNNDLSAIPPGSRDYNFPNPESRD